MCIEGWRKAGFHLVQNQLFEALHNYGRECNGRKSLRQSVGDFMGMGMILGRMGLRLVKGRG